MENTTKRSEMYTNLLKNGIGGGGMEAHKKLSLPGTGRDEVLNSLGAADDVWYSMSLSGNNGAAPEIGRRSRVEMQTGDESKKLWKSSPQQCAMGVENNVLEHKERGDTNDVNIVGDRGRCGGGGGGGGGLNRVAVITDQNIRSNGSLLQGHCRLNLPMNASGPMLTDDTNGCSAKESNYMLAGAAASLTPPANSHSNRTSVNNSTDNLSYISDDFYPDELIVLPNTISGDDDDDMPIDDDEEAEKISVYSDDCVYAYRGDGSDYDAAALRSHSNHFVDDETDFLEMDFEPDPLSEVECSSVEVTNSFLMQRDGASLGAPSLGPNAIHRPNYNSPIENIPMQKDLQSQSLLSKNFARISLHLDQIKSEESTSTTNGSRRERTSLSTTANECGASSAPAESLAQSLPNSLLTTFGRDTKEKTTTTSPSKTTGAKPKRFNTFSTASSTSSKTSSKSRISVRSSFATVEPCSGGGGGGGGGGSNNFDERSVSCTDFRCNPTDEGGGPASVLGDSDVAGPGAAAFADETCLDCLEKEFLANTIGKVIDGSECNKCRRRGGPANRTSSTNQLKSASLCYDLSDDCLFPVTDFMQFDRHEVRERTIYGKIYDATAAQKSIALRAEDSAKAEGIESQRTVCDNYCGKLLHKTVSTESEENTIATLDLTEEALVQALDELKVAYNAELIKSYFQRDTNQSPKQEVFRDFKSLKYFIVHASKQTCNHPRLKRLIEKATYNQVDVTFTKDPLATNTEMVSVKVSDLLHQWSRTNDVELLKTLDNRFYEANVLGKIANIVRQAHQRCSPRRQLPENIWIPQYYPSGYLTLTKRRC